MLSRNPLFANFANHAQNILRYELPYMLTPRRRPWKDGTAVGRLGHSNPAAWTRCASFNRLQVVVASGSLRIDSCSVEKELVIRHLLPSESAW